jgi:hypothetical protein
VSRPPTLNVDERMRIKHLHIAYTPCPRITTDVRIIFRIFLSVFRLIRFGRALWLKFHVKCFLPRNFSGCF